MFLPQKTQTYESSHAELRVVLIEGKVLLCFPFNQLLTLECVHQTLHVSEAHKAPTPCSGKLMSRVAVEVWNHIPKGNLPHCRWVLAGYQPCPGCAEFPLYSHLPSGSIQVGLSSSVCGPAANQAMCVSSLKTTSEPLVVCLQSSCIFGRLASVQTLFHQFSWNNQDTDLHTQT